MEIPSYFKKSYCDQISDQRNREFGQYDLRVTYANRMYKAQLWVLCSAIAIITVLEWFSKPVEATLPVVSNDPIVFQEVEIPVYELPKAKPTESQALPREIPPAKSDAPKVNPLRPLEITHDDKAQPFVLDTNNLKPDGNTTGIHGYEGPEKAGNPGGEPGRKGPGTGSGSPGGAEEVGTSPVEVPEILPEFQGDLQQFFAKTTHYPPRAVDEGVEGQVFVVFIVDEKGKVNKPEILKGIRKDCDDEALRVVKTMPDWTPGQMGGKPVKVRMRIPVKFKLAK